MNKLLLFFVLLPVFFVAHGQIWDMNRMESTPLYKIWTQDSVVSLVYHGLAYRGNTKEVFAYYCTPGLLSGDRSKDKNLPAMVLVHGGGGTAFRDWVTYWARRGYAAISMDLRGFGEGRQPLENGFKEPASGTPYFALGDTISEHWIYQAVGDIVYAHSLIRSFPEIDSSRTALTGISWGGVLTCIVAGLDSRFKAFVPVYGCGYLYEHSAMAEPIHSLPPVQYKRWVDWYDPSNYVGKANCPVLFVNGTNDFNFFLDTYCKTYALVNDYTLCIKPRMEHGHKPGWENDEINAFVSHILNKTEPLPVFAKIERKNDNLEVQVSAVVPLKEAALNYTTDTCDLKLRKWKSLPAHFKNETVWIHKLPENTTIWFFSVMDEKGHFVSSDLMFESN